MLASPLKMLFGAAFTVLVGLWVFVVALSLSGWWLVICLVACFVVGAWLGSSPE